MSSRSGGTGPLYQWDHPLVTFPPLVSLALERLIELDDQAQTVLAQLQVDALEAEQRGDQATAAGMRALAETFAAAGRPDPLHVLRYVRTAVEDSGRPAR